MAVVSMRRGPYKQPIQASERGQYWRSRRGARLNNVCGGWEQQLGPHQWPGRCVTPPAHTRGLSSVDLNLWVGEVGVCAKALPLQQRAVRVVVLLGTTRCHFPGIAHSFGLDPWTADGRGG
jgi:hypothetical protein